MSTLAKRVERLEAKMAPPVARKVALAFRQKTDDGRHTLTCGDVVAEQADGETDAAFDGRVRLAVGADMLIVLAGLTPIDRVMPIALPGGKVVVVPRKLMPGEEPPLMPD